MKVAILDDWHDTLRHLACFSKLNGHDVAIWTDHTADEDVLARRLADTEALVLTIALSWTWRQETEPPATVIPKRRMRLGIGGNLVGGETNTKRSKLYLVASRDRLM